MIQHAAPWKRVLLRQADALETRREQQRWGEAALVRLECTVLQGMHALRKLIEAELLPPSFAKRQIAILEYPYVKKGEGTHWRHFENHYDFDQGRKKNHPPLFVAHQVTDNAILAPKVDERGLQALYLTSNHQLHKALYELPMDELLGLFRRAGA